MGFLTDLKKQGKIRAIGASNLTPELFAEYVDAGQLDLIQEKYSLLDRANGTRFFDLCAQHDVTFQAYSPLERGTLTGKITADTQVAITLAKSKIPWFLHENRPKLAALKDKWEPLCRKCDCSIAQLVVAWTAMQGNGSNVNVLCGACKPFQIKENAAGGSLVLDAADAATMLGDTGEIV